MSVAWPATLPEPLIAHEMSNQSRAFVTEMESRRVRKRPVFGEPLKIFSFRWSFTEDQFEEFEEFYVTSLENGSVAFTITETAEGHHAACPITIVSTYAFMEPWKFSRSDNSHMVTGTAQRINRIATPTPAPDVPDNLSLTNPSSGLVLFSFDVTEDAWEVEVQRKIEGDSNDWEDFGTVDVSASGPVTHSITDTPEPDISYCYRARATSPCGDSAWTGELCITLPLEVPPAAPVLSFAIDFPNVDLEWSTVPNTDDYELERSANDSGSWSAVDSTAAPDTDYTDAPATDTDWKYRVRAVNAYGNSAWSNVINAELSTLVKLDADDVSVGSVTTWPDQGPRNTLVYQPEPGFRPSCVSNFDDGGHNAIRFFVQSTYIDNPPIGLVVAPAHLVFSGLSDDLDAGVTIFFVGVDDVSQQARPWLALGVGGSNELEIRGTYTDLINDFGGLIYAESGGSPSVNQGFTTMGNRLTIWTVRISGSAVTWWEGSSPAGTGSSAGLLDTLRSPSYLMAKDDFDAAQMSEAHLLHHLIKNRAMSDNEVQAKIYELASQYGVSL